MAEVKPSTSRGEDAVDLVGEASGSGATGSTSLESVPSAIAAESPSFLTWIWNPILTAWPALWGARGGGLSWPRVLGLASGAQQPQEYSESEVSSRIAASKPTWSEVPAHDIHPSVSDPRSSQLSVWEELKESSPGFFRDDLRESLELGHLIAEGGQAQIFEAKLRGHDCVLKVFKLGAGFSLVDLKRHWPCTMRKRGEDRSESKSMQERSPKFVFEGASSCQKKWRCLILGATLLEDGKFAFLMHRFWGDLRTLIDLKVKDSTQPWKLFRRQQPPFSFEESMHIIVHIARGLRWLHAEGVLHRDLKAANVLIRAPLEDGIQGYVADYECAMFVQGTGFWRAPEVLKELLKNKKDRNGDIWTTKVDVYSFGMTCYEILTGQIPFHGYTKSKWDDVIKGERPSLPNFISPELRELVKACWHTEPSQRPTFDVIIKELHSISFFDTICY